MRVDTSVFEIRSLRDRRTDRAFWLTKTVEERFAAVEFLRRMNYGYDEHPPRLQRILELVERQRKR